MAQKLYDMEKGSGILPGHSSIDVLVTGRSGTSKSILINGIFGREVIKERHGVVNVARSSSLEFYTSNIDGVQINVWVSSQLQDGSVTDEVNYLRDLKAQCSKVDLVLYCLKMTETRFTPGNPDDQAITKITQTLGHRVWNKTIFVLTYANVAAQIDFGSQNFDSTAKSRFTKSILEWKNVLQTTVSSAAGMPQSSFNIKVVPAGHYNAPHLPDREYWLSVFWFECSDTLSSGAAREAFYQINSSRFRKKTEIRDANIFQRGIADQPILMVNAPLNVTRILKNAGIACCIGFILGYIWGDDISLALELAVLGFGLGSLITYFFIK